MNTVRQLLQNKGHEVLSIEPHNSVYNAMQIMATRDIGSLLVLEDEKLIGIITARSFFRHIRLLDKPLKDIQVEEIMTSKVTCVGPDCTTGDCMKLLTKIKVHHLPVMENNRIIGVISAGDLIRDAISD
jgi:CBS domain-containing protein